MVALLLLAVVTEVAATPPPTIITTKTSPICTALREKIAPAISVLMVEDRLMAQQDPSYTDGTTISELAQNWIQVDKLLDPETFFHSSNSSDAKQMEVVRERLQAVADDENATLNVLSGTYETGRLEALLGRDNPMGGGLKKQVRARDAWLEILNHRLEVEDEFQRRQANTQQEETSVYPVLAPLIAQCK